MIKLKSLITLILLVSFVVIFFAWNYLPYFISNDLTRRLGVDVSISYINLGPRKIGLFNIDVDNPKGYKLKQALDVKKMAIKAPVNRYFHEKVVIEQIKLSNAYLGLEIDSAMNTNGNWTQIMDNLKSSLGGGDPNKEYFIKSIIVENLNIDLVIKSTGGNVKRIKPIAHMEFKNVSSNGDFPAGQLTQIIMREVLKEVLSPANLSSMLKQALENPAGGAQDVMNSLKSLFSFTDY